MKHKNQSKEFRLKDANVIYAPILKENKIGMLTTLLFKKDGKLFAYSCSEFDGMFTDGALNLINNRCKHNAELFFERNKSEAIEICKL